MRSSRILQIVGSLAIAYLIGLVQANPWVEPEYGAMSADYRSEQGQNTNYASSQSNVRQGSHYGDDYLTIAESSQRPRRGSRRPPPRPRKRGGPPPTKNAKRPGPPYRDDHHSSADHGHGWGGGWDGKTEKIVIHHYHAAKPEKKKRRKNIIPRLKFIPFGVKLVPFQVKVQTPKLKIRRPKLKLVY